MFFSLIPYLIEVVSCALVCIPAMAVTSSAEGLDHEDALPTPKRKRRRAKEEQGLPDDAELESLAKAYLLRASELWPELVKSGVIPVVSDSVVASMVANFKERHRTGKVDTNLLSRLVAAGLKLAANYPRFSDLNSQPKSIVDQHLLALSFAKSKGYFVPWELVVADYARSAVSGHRQGFHNLLKLIRNRKSCVQAALIDDFARGSRNEAESWKLAGLCKQHDVRLLGVSDGFHLDDPDWDTKVRLHNMFSEMENKYRRQRVQRGLMGSVGNNQPMGRMLFGYGRRPRKDENGNILRKRNGAAKTERCFALETKESALFMWELFYVKRWSTYQIAQEFNRLRIDDWDGWSDKSIECMLINPGYIGLFIWNRTTKEFNWDTQKFETVNNPWTKWKWEYNPELALVPKAWHVYARNVLVKPKKDPTRKKRRQSQRMPATLFSGTLVCGYCGSLITMCRSTPKYKNMGCKWGMARKYGCKLFASKTTATIEKTLLDVIHDRILTKDRLVGLVEAANKYLAQELSKPKLDLQPLRRRAKALKKQIDQLLDRVKRTTKEALIEVYESEIADLHAQLRVVNSELAIANRENAPVPPPLDLGRVETYLNDLRAVLNQEIPAAAEAIRALTGPIEITQEPYENKKRGARWIARFTPNVMRLLGQEAVRLDYPDSRTMEFLTSGKWIALEEMVVVLDLVPWLRPDRKLPNYEAIRRMLWEHPSLTNTEVALEFGCSITTVLRERRRMTEQKQIKPAHQ